MYANMHYTHAHNFFFFITLNVSIPEKHYAESVVGGDAEMYLLQPNVIFCMGITD